MTPRWLPVAALVLASCQPPRHLEGVVYDGGKTRVTTTGRAFTTPLTSATVTWSCPEGAEGPEAQLLTSDNRGAFRSKELGRRMPGGCMLVVTKAGYRELREPLSALCQESYGGDCSSPRVLIELASLGPTAGAPPAVPVAQPGPPAMVITLSADGRILADAVAAPDDAALGRAVDAARADGGDIRVSIHADTAVPHGRVIHVMDVVKQHGVTKIAFGVAPAGGP